MLISQNHRIKGTSFINNIYWQVQIKKKSNTINFSLTIDSYNDISVANILTGHFKIPTTSDIIVDNPQQGCNYSPTAVNQKSPSEQKYCLCNNCLSLLMVYYHCPIWVATNKMVPGLKPIVVHRKYCTNTQPCKSLCFMHIYMTSIPLTITEVEILPLSNAIHTLTWKKKPK